MNYKYIAYIRVSTKSQDYDRQIIELKSWCKSNNIKFSDVKIYSEKQSGKNFNRPILNKLINEVLNAETCLLLADTMRLGRSYEPTKQLFYELTKNSIAYVVISCPMLDTRNQKTDSTKKLIADIVLLTMTWLADEEHKHIMQRTQDGRISAKIKGIKFGRPIMTTEDIPKEVEKVINNYSQLPRTKQLTLINDLLIKNGKKTISRTTLYKYLDLLGVK